jgi:hypothetical protein
MLDEHPYLACQLSVFNLQAHRGVPLRWYIVGEVLPRSGTRRCKKHIRLQHE